MSLPKVSVIIPCYNQGHYVAEAIESCLRQTHSNVEIIVVDDGATDDTAEICERYSGRIRYIYQNNAGLPVARNTGILASTGEFLQFLDADDRILPAKFEEQLRAFEANPEVGVVYSEGFLINAQSEQIGRAQVNHQSGWVLHHLLTLWGTLVPAPLVRRSCLAHVGLFTNDPRIKGCEDIDLWMRLALRFPYLALPDTHFEYRTAANSMSSNAPMMLHSALEVIRRHRHPRCPACTQARRAGRRRWKAVFSYGVMAQARKQLECGNKGQAVRTFASVLYHDPAHFSRMMAPRYLRNKVNKIAHSLSRSSSHG